MTEQLLPLDGDDAASRIPIHLDVGATATAVGRARHRLQLELERWGCGNIPDVTLVFSELATNAFRHAGSASSALITHGDDEIRLAIDDASHTIPNVAPRTGAPGGYGLVIVDQISERWGWDQTATGKTVWSVIRCRDCG
ncbi:MAG: ATP-binding protein [Ilumatobacteraceae bacterium]